jgi:hypothetical protein
MACIFTVFMPLLTGKIMQNCLFCKNQFHPIAFTLLAGLCDEEPLEENRDAGRN